MKWRLTRGSFGVALTLGVLLLGASTAQADIVNGGFETGNFTGWTTTGNVGVVGNQPMVLAGVLDIAHWGVGASQRNDLPSRA